MKGEIKFFLYFFAKKNLISNRLFEFLRNFARNLEKPEILKNQLTQKAQQFLTPQNCALTLIDYQPAMYFGVQSHDRLSIMHNTAILAKAAKLFKIPTVLSTVAKDSFSGPMNVSITDIFKGQELIVGLLFTILGDTINL